MIRIAPLFIILGLLAAFLPSTAISQKPNTHPVQPITVKFAANREGADWPVFLGPNLDNSSPEEGILMKWPEEGLTQRWTCQLGQGYAPPVAAGGKLYHFDRFGRSNRLTARNALSGEKLWQFEYPTKYEDLYGYEPGPRCCPVVDDDRIYIYGPEGMLYSVDAESGKEVWKVDTAQEYNFVQNFFGVGSTPFVHDNLLIVAVGGSPKGPKPFDFRQVQGDGTAIVAFDKKTGSEVYRLSDELASYASPVVTEFGGRSVGLYFARGGLLGFDPANGKELFHYPWRSRMLESVNASNPAIRDGKILLTECYENGSVLLDYDGNGAPKVVWTDKDNDRFQKNLASHWATPIIHGQHIYGCSGRHTSEADIRCLDLKTGHVQWKLPRTARCTFLKVDGHILSLGEQGELRLFKLNPEKYEEVARWDADLDYPCWAPPVLSRGLLYVRGKGKLVCYELIPGK